MRKYLKIFSLSVLYLFSTKEVRSQNGPPYCNDLVTLEGRNFMCGGQLFYPVVCEYGFEIIHHDQTPALATDYFLSRAASYGTTDYYEGTDEAACSLEIHNDLTMIHKMGFNCIRTSGIWGTFDVNDFELNVLRWTHPPNNYIEHGSFIPTDFVQVSNQYGSGSWEGCGYKIPIGTNDPGNYRGHYFYMIKEVLEIAHECSLKVILDIGAEKLIDMANQSNYLDYLYSLGVYISGLTSANNDLYNTLIAYSPIEEPEHMMAPAYTKKTICDATENIYFTLKAADPHHLITMGTIVDHDIFLWDPGVMKFDFLSPHFYPFPTLGNTPIPFEVNDDKAVERMISQILWWKDVCPYPWIIGETGFLANGIDHYPATANQNLPTKVWGELETPQTGATYSQSLYARMILKLTRNCGGSGISWWEFQDVNWANFGLLKKNGEASDASIYPNIRKPVVSEFENYLDQNGQPPPVNIADITYPSLYYDMCDHAHYNPNTNYISGTVNDADTYEPIKNAAISATTFIHDHLLGGQDVFDNYLTFTHEDGSFTAIPYDYWVDPGHLPDNELVDLVVTTVGGERVEKGNGSYWGINSGPILGLPQPWILNLKRNADKRITNVTITSGNSASYQSFVSLTSKDVTIDANATADFMARKEINVQEEFFAKEGSEVLIHLGDVFPDCSDYTSYVRLSSNEVNTSSTNNNSNSKDIIINFLSKDLFIISPNPSNGIFNIKFTKLPTSENNIKVYNAFDELIYTVNVSEKELDLNLCKFAKGVYFIAVKCEKQIVVKKIVIQ